MKKPKPRAERARKPVVKPQTKPPHFFFRFLGWYDGWYVLRADMTPKPSHGLLDALEFENGVVEWLITQRITPGKYSHIGNGNTGTGPMLPAVHDGSAVCLLLKRATDVLRFEMRFVCRGITPETMLEAMRLEAKVVRLGTVEIAQVVYEANSRLNILVGGESHPAWDDTADEYRQMVIAGVQTQMDHPDWTSEQLHDYWMKDRLAQGWTFGPKRDHKKKTHPSLVPFNRLSLLEQAKDQMFRNIVAALMPLSDD